jgi:hypothetical protein
MKRSSVLYFLSFYNDIDHAAPIIDSQLKDQVTVHVVCNSRFNIKTDSRFRYFTRFQNFYFHPLRALPRTSGTSNQARGPLKLWQKVVRELLFSRWWAAIFLKHHQITCVIFTWGKPKAKGIQRRFFEACRLTGVGAVCIPHGQNIYKNLDVNTALRETFKRTGQWPDFSDRNAFDRYIVQTERHLSQVLAWGMSPNTAKAVGSPRFLPSWISFNRKLIRNTISQPAEQKHQTVIVFFLPHWRYNVDYDATIDLILQLSKDQELELVIKGHTRGDSIGNSTIQQSGNKSNIHWQSTEESPILIERADLVINFGSSIAIEALVTKTPVIYPEYLHHNETIFDNPDIVKVARNATEVIEFVSQYKKGQIHSPSALPLEAFLKTEVFNNYLLEDDVIQAYRREIE